MHSCSALQCMQLYAAQELIPPHGWGRALALAGVYLYAGKRDTAQLLTGRAHGRTIIWHGCCCSCAHFLAWLVQSCNSLAVLNHASGSYPHCSWQEHSTDDCVVGLSLIANTKQVKGLALTAGHRQMHSTVVLLSCTLSIGCFFQGKMRTAYCCNRHPDKWACWHCWENEWHHDSAAEEHVWRLPSK